MEGKSAPRPPEAFPGPIPLHVPSGFWSRAEEWRFRVAAAIARYRP
jgi:hypothetical protein